MKIEEAAQKQIDEIMDTFKFNMVVEGLKVNPHCALNKINEEDRETTLRTRSREYLYYVVEKTIYKYRHNGKALHETGVETGCMKATCIINNYEEPWIRVNLQAILATTIIDGILFAE